jgi:DNA polymerase beta
MDYTDKIIEILNLFLIKEQQSSDTAAPFKVRAYKNAIKFISEYNKPIHTKEDVDDVQFYTGKKSFGDKIRDKLYEIVETGQLEEAKGLKAPESVRDELLNIYGIGPVKADELINQFGIKSLDDLRALALKDRTLLTEAQLMGLAFYSDLIQRIPRNEMMEHEKYIREFFLEYAPEFSLTIVGSYRREESTSGDVDILLTYHDVNYEQAKLKFSECLDMLIEEEYIIGTLAKGKSKFMGLVQLFDDNDSYKVRRMDILLTKPEEFACALLYFTGSQKFNVNFRNVAILKGYTLNEHRLKKKDEDSNIPEPPYFKTEKDIFDFLGIKYLHPNERVGDIELLF